LVTGFVSVSFFGPAVSAFCSASLIRALALAAAPPGIRVAPAPMTAVPMASEIFS
jgi:hypothetical protein